jgi:hypothetical protein
MKQLMNMAIIKNITTMRAKNPWNDEKIPSNLPGLIWPLIYLYCTYIESSMILKLFPLLLFCVFLLSTQRQLIRVYFFSRIVCRF